MRKLIATTALIPLFFTIFSQNTQQKCSSAELLKAHLLADSLLKNRLWAIEKQTQQILSQQHLSERCNNTIYIPIVVHILHRTHAENISNEQVYSQIEALNRDFNKQNEDAWLTPSVFLDAVADCNIHFALVNQDEKGNATTGILRTKTERFRWNNPDDIKLDLKGGSPAWNASKYLNIWVGNLGGKTLGVATYPGANPDLDGIVIDYTAFGTIGNIRKPYSKGRTCVHEIGHWLNLHHLWGDTDCGNDLVADTPLQKKEHFGNPFFPYYSTCNGVQSTDMTMNFMNYVDDDYMYMFTHGQKMRMRALFEKGGLRESMHTPKACSGVNNKINEVAETVFTFFPNPVMSNLTVDFGRADVLNIQLLDMVGNICYQRNQISTPSVSIDVSDLKEGIYLLRIFKNGYTKTKKFIKIKE